MRDWSDHDMYDDDWVEIEAEIKHQTRKAFLVEHNGEEVWLPKSQVKNRIRRGGSMHFTITSWLAGVKGLPYDAD